jgi:uncharacterized protein (UPF0276 family)
MNAPSRDDIQGVGLGLRVAFGRALLDRAPDAVRWLEVHPENYIGRGGRFLAMLEEAAEQWSIVPHGLTSNFGSPDRFEQGWLAELRRFLDRIDAPWYSDHLCFCATGHAHLFDLLPLPRTAETIAVCVDRIHELQDALGRPVAIENVSAYLPQESEMPEIEFLLEVVDRADALMLLDVNNVYVNACNHGFDPRHWLAQVPAERVAQLHVAGHLVRSDGLRIDTHGEPICDDVYGLLGEVLRRIGPRPVLLERDNNTPPLDELVTECERLQALVDAAWDTQDV